ncbi:MAG TPA: hypothetical protein DEP46_17335 [Blastocatellia bacterium]|nr:hypothetical protein [Blastocatellia bacterium]
MHKYAMTIKEIFRGQLFVIIGLFAVVGCSIGSETGSAVVPEVEEPASIPVIEEWTADIPEPPMVVVKKSGWIQLDRRQFRVTQPRERLESEPRFYYSKYTPKKTVRFSTICDEDVDPAEKAACVGYVMGREWSVREIIAYDRNERTFCYKVVAADIRNGQRGGLVVFVFSDQNGDGIFESLHLSDAAETFPIPKWAEE